MLSDELENRVVADGGEWTIKSGRIAGPTRSAPSQSAFGLPPVSSFGSVSSIARGQVGDPARAAVAEASAGDANYLRMEYFKAWERYRRAVELDPSKAGYFLKLGMAAVMAGRPEHAERNMLEAIRLAPNFAHAHEALAQYYLEHRQIESALKHSEVAFGLDSKDIDHVVTRGAVLAADGQPTAAWDLITTFLDAGVRHTRLVILYARLAPQFGHNREALLQVDSSLNAGVHRTYEPRLHFAAASLLDRLGRYDDAFAHARKANDALANPFDPSAFARDVDRTIAYFTRERIRCLPKSMVDDRRIVFVVGMPRSGTSLVEQILASHHQVFGAGESSALLQVQNDLRSMVWSEGAGFPDSLGLLSISEANRLARRYLSAMELPGAENATCVIDKTPMNLLNLGLAQLLLPNSRVIHCTRSPLDTCVSCYLTDFTAGQEYSSDLEKLASVFRTCQRLMAHWKQVLTIPIHEVRYEDLVLGLESQSRRITDFLGLPWDRGCLKFHENPRRVHTASREQVRQPVYLSSIGRWKNYEKHISKLIAALATA